MALPELVRRTAEKVLSDYCRRKIPPCAMGDVRLRFAWEEDGAVLYEDHCTCRSEASVARPVARFRFSPDLAQWTLHYPGPDRRWLFYLNAGPSLDLGKLLRHLENDPLGIFWT